MLLNNVKTHVKHNVPKIVALFYYQPGITALVPSLPSTRVRRKSLRRCRVTQNRKRPFSFNQPRVTSQVCRDYLRGNCSRGEHDCRYGHPPDKTSVDPNDNCVTVCMDFIKGRCSRDACKYFHPPAHLQVHFSPFQGIFRRPHSSVSTATVFFFSPVRTPSSVVGFFLWSFGAFKCFQAFRTLCLH